MYGKDYSRQWCLADVVFVFVAGLLLGIKRSQAQNLGKWEHCYSWTIMKRLFNSKLQCSTTKQEISNIVECYECAYFDGTSTDGTLYNTLLTLQSVNEGPCSTGANFTLVSTVNCWRKALPPGYNSWRCYKGDGSFTFGISNGQSTSKISLNFEKSNFKYTGSAPHNQSSWLTIISQGDWQVG